MEHPDEITRKANKRLYHLRQCRKSQLPTDVGLVIYTTKIRPILEYASPVWGGLPGHLEDEIERVQNRCLRILGLERGYLPSLSDRRNLAIKREVKRMKDEPNHPCHNILPKPIDHNYNLRKTDDSRGPTVFSRTERHTSSLSQYLA